MPIERRRDTPYSAGSVCPLLQLVEVVLLDPIGRIGHDRMDSRLGNTAHPLKAVSVDHQRFLSSMRLIV